MNLKEKRVLFVDDEPRIHAYTQKIGKLFNSKFAFSPKQAWQIIEKEKQPFDLIVSDINMPRGNPTGIKFVKELRKKFPKTKILMHSDDFFSLELLEREGFKTCLKQYDGSDEKRLKEKILKMLKIK
jgi:CheY-like chemotaxis protein